MRIYSNWSVRFQEPGDPFAELAHADFDRRGETLGVYVHTRRKRPKTAHMSELKEAADRTSDLLLCGGI